MRDAFNCGHLFSQIIATIKAPAGKSNRVSPACGSSFFSQDSTFPLTFHWVHGYQRRSQRAETVKRFSQQPLLPIPIHLPVTCANVIGHRKAGHVGESFLFLKRKEDGKYSFICRKLRLMASEVMCRWLPWCVCLFVQSQRPFPPPSPPPSVPWGTCNIKKRHNNNSGTDDWIFNQFQCKRI